MEAPAPKHRLAGRYVLEELIDTGGMAAIWRARDEVLARMVAVKLLRSDLAGDPEFAKRFHREAVAAARLTHTNIVSVYDTGVDDGVSFIVMELSDGRNLSQVMKDRGPLEPEEAADLICPVLSALAYAHATEVIHRDIKPANILVGGGGRVQVTDFGIAKAAFAGTDLQTTGKALGTVRYLSPEQVQGSDVDARSDLYSTGIVLYELLTGRVPFRAESDMAVALMRLSQDPIPPRAFRGGIPRDVEGVVLRALARRPEDRFQSADSMLAALERATGSTDLSATQRFAVPRAGHATEPVAPRHPGRAPSVFRSWMLVPLILILLAGAAIAGGLALGRLRLGGPLGVRAAPKSPAEAPPAAGLTRINVVSARDFDPEGDGQEHPNEAPFAVDGQQGTSWSTDHYKSAQFGNLKSGLGLWLDLGNEQAIQRAKVTSSIVGWEFEIRTGSLGQSSAETASAANGSTTFTVGASGQVVVNLKPVRTSALLIWITRLGQDGGRYAASISEVEVQGKG